MPSFEHHGARIYYETFGAGLPDPDLCAGRTAVGNRGVE